MSTTPARLPPPRHGRALPVLAALALATALGVPFEAAAQAPAQASAQATGAASATASRPPSPRPASFREIKWEELVPADWDPMKGFAGLNMNILSDNDPRATALLKKMREAWDAAPVNNQMNEVAVRLPGYLVPLEEGKAGMTEFLLVPYFGACIHTPPPPANQIIHVLPQTPARNLKSMDTIWVSGILRTLRTDSYMGVSGYRLEAMVVEPYVEKKK